MTRFDMRFAIFSVAVSETRKGRPSNRSITASRFQRADSTACFIGSRSDSTSLSG
jgi:hypothetical protein